MISPYQYLEIRVKDVNDCPIEGIPASSFSFTVAPDYSSPPTDFYGNLSMTFVPVDTATNNSGKIRFEIIGDTSIIGWVNITAVVNDVTLNDDAALRCNSVDLNCDGVVNLSDISLFTGYYYGPYHFSADYYWDGYVNMSDLVAFAQHNNHHF